ncbi:hypothetical protein [Anaeromassilibacillus sp. SJQ-1]
MVTLIIGGAASGKSAYAEELAMQSPEFRASMSQLCWRRTRKAGRE